MNMTNEMYTYQKFQNIKYLLIYRVLESLNVTKDVVLCSSSYNTHYFLCIEWITCDKQLQCFKRLPGDNVMINTWYLPDYSFYVHS